MGPKEKVCLLPNFPPPLLVGPAHSWNLVLQKNGDLSFTVYYKALPVNLVFKTVIHIAVNV